MSILASYASKLKTILLTGTMLLTTLTAVAQQEVDPDHFDGSSAQARPIVVKHQKQSASVHKTNSSPKRQNQAKASKKPKQPSVIATR